MKYLYHILVSIDQLGNTFSGGNPDNTISSRVGYYTRSNENSRIPFHWRLFRNIINFTFYPVDGKYHCKKAYYNDAGEVFDEDTNNIGVAVVLAFF